jgi:hypothetical protein
MSVVGAAQECRRGMPQSIDGELGERHSWAERAAEDPARRWRASITPAAVSLGQPLAAVPERRSSASVGRSGRGFFKEEQC